MDTVLTSMTKSVSKKFENTKHKIKDEIEDLPEPVAVIKNKKKFKAEEQVE